MKKVLFFACALFAGMAGAAGRKKQNRINLSNT